MSTVSLLLATKLYRPPPRSGLVPRLRRTARLSEGLAKPLTLVAAPTGFGKTTVVSEWIAGGQPSPIAWVSLDEDDNDPTRFFTYLVAALQNLQSDIGETALALLQSTPPSSPKTVLTALINDLSQDDPSPMTKVGDRPHVLVLDDYHVITTPPIHEALTFLLDHLPPTLRLIISTREDPPLPLARWRARGQLSEIRADDLRFSSERDTEPGVRAEPDSDRSEPVGTAFESVAPASLF